MEKRQGSRKLWLVIGVLLFGAMIGSLAGEILKMVLPEGVVKEVLLRSIDISLGPASVDLIMLSLTIGFSLNLNLIGIVGLLIAYYLFRYWR